MEQFTAELRDIQSLAIFKCKLRTYLFRVAFKAYPAWYSLLLVLLIKFIIIIINVHFINIHVISFTNLNFIVVF